MSKWIRTPDYKLIDLEKFDMYWIEKYNDKFKCFTGRNDNNYYPIGIFEKQEDAEKYIAKIHSILGVELI